MLEYLHGTRHIQQQQLIQYECIHRYSPCTQQHMQEWGMSSVPTDSWENL